jgi:hypothetical protein
MTIRRKLFTAAILAVVIFVGSMNLLRSVAAKGAYFLLATIVIFGGFYLFANTLRCPRCNARASPPSRLATPFFPKRCANCGYDLSDPGHLSHEKRDQHS